MTMRCVATNICLLTALASLIIETQAQALYDFIFPVETNYIPISQSVAYDCQIQNKWSKDTHPVDFPIHDNPHLSPPLIVSHSKEYSVWNAGFLASPGIKQMAETGKTETLKQELQTSKSVKDIVQWSIQTLQQNESDLQIMKGLQIRLDAKYSYITTISKVTPSPDWFTGFQNFQPINHTSNTWLDGFTINTYPIDAGTKSGNSYMQTGSTTSETIFRYTETTVPDTFVFLDQFGSSVPPVATWSCVRQNFGSIVEPPSSLQSKSQHEMLIGRNDINDGGVRSNLPVSTPVQYSVTFSGTWTANNHPKDYPSSAMFSPHILLVHSNGFQLWTAGELASQAVIDMAENGNGAGIVEIINNDMGQNIKDATIGSDATGVSIANQPIGILSLDSTFNSISSIVTIVPSPDWFTGFSSVQPIEDGNWLRQFSIDAMPFDVGTKSGTTYAQQGESLVSPNAITPITSDTNSVFTTTTDAGIIIAPLGQYNFELLTEEPPSTPTTSTPTVSPTSAPIDTPVTITTAPTIPTTLGPTTPTGTSPENTPTPAISSSPTMLSTTPQQPSIGGPTSPPITQSPIISNPVSNSPSLPPTISQITSEPTEIPSGSPSSQPTREPRLIIATDSYDIVDAFTEYNIPLWQPISYDCQFRNTWTANRHPKDYPLNASWSKPFVVSHSLNYDLWKVGTVASSSVQQLIRSSDSSALEEVLSNALSMTFSSVGDFRIGSDQILDNNSAQSIEDIKVNEKHSFISTIAGMSPSPDWFSGLLKFSPTRNETWLDEFILETYPWDAGIDAGNTYTSPSTPSVPLQLIYRLTNTTIPDSKVYLDPDGKYVRSVASWQCVRQKDEFLHYEDQTIKQIPIDKTVIEDDFELSDVEITSEAEYSVTFSNSWTAENHPFDFPPNGRLTPHVFVSHNSDFELWRPGIRASDAVKRLAEEGDESGLYALMGEAGESLLDGARGNEIIGTLRFDSDRRYVTSISKIDPSPDWFTGMTNIETVRDGRWLRKFTVFVLPFDAGTDAGNNYASSNIPQVPTEVITRITRSSVPRDKPVFVGSNDGKLVYPLGRFDFELLNTPSPTATEKPSQYLSVAPSEMVSPINSPSSAPVQKVPTTVPVASLDPVGVPTIPPNPGVFSLSPTVKVDQPISNPNTPFQPPTPPQIPTNVEVPTIPPNPGVFSLSPTMNVDQPILSPNTPFQSPTFPQIPPNAEVPTIPPNPGVFSPSPTMNVNQPISNPNTPFQPPTTPQILPSGPTNTGGFSLSPTVKVGPISAPTSLPSLGTPPPLTTFKPTLLPSRIITVAPVSFANPTSLPTTLRPTLVVPATLLPSPKPSDIPTNPALSPTLMPIPSTGEPSRGEQSEEEFDITNFNFWNYWKPKPYSDEPSPDSDDPSLEPVITDSPVASPTVRVSTNPSRKPISTPPYVSYLSPDDDLFFEVVSERDPEFYGIDVTLSQKEDDDLFIDIDALDPDVYKAYIVKSVNTLQPLGENSDEEEETKAICAKPHDKDVCIEVYIPINCNGCPYSNMCKALSAGYNYEECSNAKELSSPNRSDSLSENPSQNIINWDTTKDDGSNLRKFEENKLDPTFNSEEHLSDEGAVMASSRTSGDENYAGSGRVQHIASGERQTISVVSIGCAFISILVVL